MGILDPLPYFALTSRFPLNNPFISKAEEQAWAAFDEFWRTIEADGATGTHFSQLSSFHLTRSECLEAG